MGQQGSRPDVNVGNLTEPAKMQCKFCFLRLLPEYQDMRENFVGSYGGEAGTGMM